MRLELPEPVTYDPLTRTDLVRYAGASGDFNPLHHDHAFAAAAGLPDVMAHGMLSAGLLGSALTRWYGAGAVRRYAMRFKAPVWPGDVLVARCIEIAPEKEADGTVAADLVLELARDKDDVVLSATARVAIGQQPRAGEESRSGG